MAVKKSSKKKKKVHKSKAKSDSKKKAKKTNPKDFPTLNLKTENDIAMDFAVKAYKKFDKLVKSIILFGSTAKQEQTVGSDIDIIIILDDVSVKWDQELIAWYREELEKLIQSNPYSQSLHINTVKVSTWWDDLIRGDPVIINIIRYGEAMIDYGGFFIPIKRLLIEGKIRATPEAIYACLQRAPGHLARSKMAEMSAVEGLYWCMVDSAHAALISANVSPPSPEHIAGELKMNFVDKNKLKMKYVLWYRDLLDLHKKIEHRKITDLKGIEIDMWQERTEDFLNTMAKLVKEIIDEK